MNESFGYHQLTLEELQENLEGWKEYLGGMQEMMADLSAQRILLEQDAPTNPDIKKLLDGEHTEEEMQVQNQIKATVETIRAIETQILLLKHPEHNLTPDELAELEAEMEEEIK